MITSNLHTSARLLSLAATIMLAGCANAPGPVILEGSVFADRQFIDLTHNVAAYVAFWPTACEFRLEEVAVADLPRWEGGNSRLPDGAILLVCTDFSERRPDKAAYLGKEERGATAVPQLHIPDLSADLACFLAEECAIGAVGSGGPLRIVAHLPRS